MKSAPLPPGIHIASIADLAEVCAEVRSVVVNGAETSLLITRRGSAVAVFRNRCPHAGYPLQRADGRVLVQGGRYAVCAAHGASFLLENGACVGGPCNGEPLERVAVNIENGVVLTA
mgnify:CR=1 FL=1